MLKLTDKGRDNCNRLIDSVIEELEKAGYDVSTLTESYAIACVYIRLTRKEKQLQEFVRQLKRD